MYKWFACIYIYNDESCVAILGWWQGEKKMEKKKSLRATTQAPETPSYTIKCRINAATKHSSFFFFLFFLQLSRPHPNFLIFLLFIFFAQYIYIQPFTLEHINSRFKYIFTIRTSSSINYILFLKFYLTFS